jgi:hypothetical protein
MDEDQVDDMLADLVERLPDAVRDSLGIVGSGEGQAATGEQDRGAFGHGRPADALAPSAEKVTALDDGRGHAGTMVEA